MYLDFYQLKKPPFHITPDPEFLFLSPSHKAALGAIIYGIEERQGFVAITGEVGLGKTTILRSYLERVDSQKLRTIYIFNANLSFRSLLKLIFQEFELDLEDIVLFDDEDLFELVDRLHKTLIQEYKRGRNVALIIDEAQNMPVETLENLRMLSNLETATEKLVQIVLIGQPEFEHKLDLHELRQLKQRLVIRSTIAPLTGAESLAYIEHRLAKVARSAQPIFTKGALQCIIEAAKGTPRTLNILSTNALIAGFGYQQYPIPAETVREVIGQTAGHTPRASRRPVLVGAVAACVAAGLFLATPYGQTALARLAPYVPWQEVQTLALPQSETPLRRTTPPPAPPPEDHAERTVSLVQEPTLEKPLEKLDQILHHANGHTGTEVRSSGGPTSPLPLADIKMTEPPFVRTINKGESVSKVVTEVYGVANDATLELVKKYNPHIQDVNKVATGTKLVLPRTLPTQDTNH